jgi:hypothetical protein
MADDEVDYVIDDSPRRQEKLNIDVNNLGNIAKDRNGKPLEMNEMRNLQNRLMNRPPDFESWSTAKKNNFLLKELQNYHLSQLPPIEELTKLNDAAPTVITVDKDTNIHDNTAPRVNLKAGNVLLTLVADNKTIAFNNREALDAYRNAIKVKNNEAMVKVDTKKVINAQLGNEIHKGRVWE